MVFHVLLTLPINKVIEKIICRHNTGTLCMKYPRVRRDLTKEIK